MKASSGLLRTAAGYGLGWLSGRNRLAVFTYHRILEQADELLDEPTAQQFARHVQFIAAHLKPLPLREAVSRLYAGTLPARAACVTFDDGYRNNFEVAAPILERAGVPATFFVTTGAIESGSMWNDRVIESVRRAPEHWDLTSHGLGQWAFAAGSRKQTIGQILERFKYMPHDEREQVASAVFAEQSTDGLDLMMSPDMIRDLSRRGFDIGGHTVTHPILKNLADADARWEIATGRDWLADVTGEMPRTFAYPNGRPGIDFDVRHARMVEELGFACAVSTDWAVARPDHDAFALPRFTPWEFDERGWLLRIAKTYANSRLGR